MIQVFSTQCNLPLPVMFPVCCGTGYDPEMDDSERSSGEGSVPHEDLPYRVELWDVRKQVVEIVLAVTANTNIGYAAYFAATREHPDRYVTFRHKNRTIMKSNGPEY